MRTVLFVANYPSNTGFAWTHIERLFAKVASVLHEEKVRTLVAYPRIDEPPRTLLGSPAEAVELDATMGSHGSLRQTLRFVRHEGVDVVYLTDQPLWNWRYAVLRSAGVRRIIVHDRVSGYGTPPWGLKRLIKGVGQRTPMVTADRYVAVSDFVERRLIEIGRIPPDKIERIYNGFQPPRLGEYAATPDIRDELEVGANAPLIACASRAAREKGVDHLFRAFDRLASRWASDPAPVLCFLGDGPYLGELRRLRDELPSRARIHVPGYLPDAVCRLRTADIFVVPSVWQDAFPSAVLEPMAWGRPVIASGVGGIPEMIEHGRTGLLVPPGDEEALGAAMESLLQDRDRASALGQEGRRRVEARFRPADQVSAVVTVIRGVESAGREG